MNRFRLTLFLPVIFIAIAGGALLYLTIKGDSQMLETEHRSWQAAIAATAPRLIVDGNLVKLQALLKTRPEIETIICDQDETILLGETHFSVGSKCPPPSATANKVQMTFDSKPIGYIVTKPLNQLTAFSEKYVLIILAIALISILTNLAISKHRESRIIAELVDFISNDKTQFRSNNHDFGRTKPLVDAVIEFKNTQSKLTAIEIELEKNKIFSAISRQVAHDIRSPLTALDLLLKNIEGVPEDLRLITRSAVGRIRDIANDLNRKGKELSLTKNLTHSSISETTASTKAEPQLLSGLIESIVTEKRLEYREHLNTLIQFDAQVESYGVFAAISAMDLGRAISNLINNSVEALPNQHGQIDISLYVDASDALITVTDNGVGVPQMFRSLVGKIGWSFGKANIQNSGSGLGFAQAKSTIECVGGKIDLTSEQDRGTVVTIRLPRAPTPTWFAERIQLPPGAVVVVVDDDPAIHQIWTERFESFSHGEDTVVHLASPDQFRQWFRLQNPSEVQNCHFLIDYEFAGKKYSGLDLIGEFGIKKLAQIVTSHHEEPAIIAAASALNITVIPKTSAPLIPIQRRYKGQSAADTIAEDRITEA